jgi:hypothetical protein
VEMEESNVKVEEDYAVDAKLLNDYSTPEFQEHQEDEEDDENDEEDDEDDEEDDDEDDSIETSIKEILYCSICSISFEKKDNMANVLTSTSWSWKMLKMVIVNHCLKIVGIHV